MAFPGVMRNRWHSFWLRLTGFIGTITNQISQERLIAGLTISAVLLANLLLVFLFFRQRESIGFVLVAAVFVLPAAFWFPELAIWLYLALVSSDLLNAVKIATGGFGGRLPLMFLLLFYCSGRATIEYVRLPKDERPRLFSVFTVALALFLVYYLIQAVRTYLNLEAVTNASPVSPAYLLNENYGNASLFIQYIGYPLTWVMVFPAIILLREPARLKRFMYIIVPFIALLTLFLAADYFINLPPMAKAILGIQKGEETAEGYRVRSVARQSVLLGATFALGFVGLNRKLNRPWLYGLLLLGLIAIIATKTRSLWFAYALGAMFLLPIRPVWANLRLVAMAGVILLFTLTLMLHPLVYNKVTQLTSETIARLANVETQLSTQTGTLYSRFEEKDKAMYKFNQATTWQRLFGFGLDGRYGKFKHTYLKYYGMIKFKQEETYMHINWMFYLFKTGYVGLGLLITMIGAFFIRAWQVLRYARNTFAWVIVGTGVAFMLGSLVQASLHAQFFDDEAVGPFVICWTFLELAPYWYKRGFLPELERGESKQAA